LGKDRRFNAGTAAPPNRESRIIALPRIAAKRREYGPRCRPGTLRAWNGPATNGFRR
jgi:hypothetical protein